MKNQICSSTSLPLLLLGMVLVSLCACGGTKTMSLTEQVPEKCGAMPYMANALAQNPDWTRVLQENENLILSAQKQALALSPDTIIIPVVVHVLWNLAVQNVSDAQILSQINVLNEDYRKMQGTRGYNNSPIGADTKIEFRLAQFDPLSKPSNGIERVQTKVAGFYHDDKVKSTQSGGANAWDANQYLNLWVCNLLSNTPGKTLLGYASFPGGPANLDGVVINYQAFGDSVGTSISGSANLGRTTTHEVGHWLNLFHTFQDGCPNTNCLEQGDKVCDTPPVDTPTSGCPPNRVSCGVQSLTNDYMDYSSDACMNLFTEGQNFRVRMTMDYIRKPLKTSKALRSNDFFVFGQHVGKYNYVLDHDFSVTSSGPYSAFSVPSGSSVVLNPRGGQTVSLDANVRVEAGGVFVVRQQ